MLLLASAFFLTVLQCSNAPQNQALHLQTVTPLKQMQEWPWIWSTDIAEMAMGLVYSVLLMHTNYI